MTSPALRPDAAWNRFVTMWRNQGELEVIQKGKAAEELRTLLGAFAPEGHMGALDLFTRAVGTLNPSWWDQVSATERKLLLKALDKYRRKEQVWWLTNGASQIEHIAHYLEQYDHPQFGSLPTAVPDWDGTTRAALRAWSDWASGGQIWETDPPVRDLMAGPIGLLLHSPEFAHPVVTIVYALSEFPTWLEDGIGSNLMARTTYRAALEMMSRLGAFPGFLTAVDNDPAHFQSHIAAGMAELTETRPATGVPADPFFIDLSYLPPLVEGRIGKDMVALRFDTQVLVRVKGPPVAPESLKVHLQIDVGDARAAIDHIEPRTGVEELAVHRMEDSDSSTVRGRADVRLPIPGLTVPGEKGGFGLGPGVSVGGDVSKGHSTRESVQSVHKVVRVKADVFERDAWWEFTPTPTFDLVGTHRLTIKMLAPAGVTIGRISGDVEVGFADGRVQRYEEFEEKELPGITRE